MNKIIKCLSVKQPFADLLTKIVSRDADGNWLAEKSIELRSRRTNYRGDVLICSCKNPVIEGRLSGYAVGIVEIYGCKPVEEFTEDDWKASCVENRWKSGYGWLVRNPRRVVEVPVDGKLGLFNMEFPENHIVAYPREMAFGPKGWEMIQKKIVR